MNDLFQWCVFVLRVSAEFLGITYEELNIYIFVILHPVITIFFICLWWKERSARVATAMKNIQEG